MNASLHVMARGLLTAQLFLALAFSASVSAQECTPHDITLGNQAEVNNFQANHGPCDRMGNLRIEGPDIVNLDGLIALTNVSGDLIISFNDALTNMGGLSKLTSVGALYIEENNVLINLDGLSSLANVAGTMHIALNHSLTDVDALSAVKSVSRLRIGSNDSLTNVNGLLALASVNTDVSIGGNGVLSSLDGLSALQEVHGDLGVGDNPSLTSCGGLATLVDAIDDYQPGPGPGPSGIPDIGLQATFSNNLVGCNSVAEILAANPFLINAGLIDAWYNPATNGQGFLITVFPERTEMFLAWFTFDTERPPEDVGALLGEPGHRWLTAQGPYIGDIANLTIFVTEGGVFDAAEPAATTDPAGDGTMTIEFADCENGLVSYQIASLGISGEIPIQRITNDNVALCETLSGQ